MSDTPPLLIALRALRIDAHAHVPLVKKTWWRVGGPADVYAELRREDELVDVQRVCAEHRQPVFVLGNASNLLISDRGVRGLVIRLVGGLAQVRVEGDTLVLGGGVKLVGLVRQMQREGWTGLEMLAGIPGTIGGAVRTNAGTRLGELSDRLCEVGLVLGDGTRTVAPVADLHMGYRSARVPEGAIVAWVRVSLTGDDPAASRALIDEHLAYRARTQPTDVPTCGSTFRNPPSDHAGRLIEATGLKGLTIGAAQVSPKHANFVVNLGGATAADIRTLIETIQRRVHDAHGTWLQPEVHYAGDWQGWGDDA